MFTQKDREKIIRAFTETHGGVFDPAVFVKEVEAKGAKHPAHGWFEWDTDEAARQYRLEQARSFARGIRINFTVQEVSGGKISIRETLVPMMLSPVDGRQRGGGYIATENGNPEHLAELCLQASRDLEAWLRRYAGAVAACGGNQWAVEHLVAQLRAATALPRDQAA